MDFTQHKLLVANRGEICVRVLRTARELNLPTVAIYAFEDRFSDHYQDATEGAMIGQEGEFNATEAYLNIPRIIEIAKQRNVTMIHPGYGFLSEDEAFAQAVENAGIIFVGPSSRILRDLGSKVAARRIAEEASVPTIPGTKGPIEAPSEVSSFISKYGYPVLIKAAYGGGGRGQRIIAGKEPSPEEIVAQTQETAKQAFGSSEVFLERFLRHPKHIEVQILGDKHGNVIHLFERDCTVQRRHQKIIEIAPAVFISTTIRQKLHEFALRIAQHVGYENAGTVEFLVEGEDIYFIEVNPRIQVEHTVSESITDIDLIRAQILVANGISLKEIGLEKPLEEPRRVSIQSRVTSEIPSMDFRPSTGTISYCRVPSGPGIRVDGYNLFAGAHVTPFFDPLLFKCIVTADTFEAACAKTRRALQECKFEGIDTNIAFLVRIFEHKKFLNNEFWTRLLDMDNELREPTGESKDQVQQLLSFFAENYVNDNLIEGQTDKPAFLGDLQLPELRDSQELINTNISCQKGWKNLLAEKGPQAFAKAVRHHPQTLLTDTTWRDAHQSLLATRVRTIDFSNIAKHTSHAYRSAYSLECWGGATFDVSLRFLHEDPWHRLVRIWYRKFWKPTAVSFSGKLIHDIGTFLSKCSCEVSVVLHTQQQAVKNGMDIIRVFDGLNDISNLEIGIDASLKAGAVVEAALLYTGDMMQPGAKYSLDYYMNIIDKVVKAGAHVISVKSMSGVMKPEAARVLVSTIRKRYADIPIHMHTHDAAGVGTATMLACVEAGADIIDGATDSLSGTTSQPAMTSLLAGLANRPGAPEMDFDQICAIDRYWAQLRLLYSGFDAKLTTPDPDVYWHEIPGGQLSNLIFQARQLGLGQQWQETKKAFSTANQLLGNIVKATPTSKAVGDLAQFMVNKELSHDDVIAQADTLDFPASVLDFFQGLMGQPVGGFPEPLRTKALRGIRKPISTRPGEYLPAINLLAVKEQLTAEYGTDIHDGDVCSYIMYPEVFTQNRQMRSLYGDLSVVPTRYFLAPLNIGEDVEFPLNEDKILRLKLLAISPRIDERAERDVFFQVDGQYRQVTVRDLAAMPKTTRRKADPRRPAEIGAPLAGKITKVLGANGNSVKKGQIIMVISAMKMDLNVSAPMDGVVRDIGAAPQDSVDKDDLLFAVEQ